jgi:hypothetical protein
VHRPRCHRLIEGCALHVEMTTGMQPNEPRPIELTILLITPTHLFTLLPWTTPPLSHRPSFTIHDPPSSPIQHCHLDLSLARPVATTTTPPLPHSHCRPCRDHPRCYQYERHRVSRRTLRAPSRWRLGWECQVRAGLLCSASVDWPLSLQLDRVNHHVARLSETLAATVHKRAAIGHSSSLSMW